MLAVSFLQWWYSRGWGIYFRGFIARLHSIADFFSIGLLLKTLFSPFRQISAGESSENGKFMVVFLDKLVSRFIGFFIRFFIIIFGIIGLSATLAIGLVIAIIWPCIPVLPFVGIVVSSMGVVF
jgi:hypothetical protein